MIRHAITLAFLIVFQNQQTCSISMMFCRCLFSLINWLMISFCLLQSTEIIHMSWIMTVKCLQLICILLLTAMSQSALFFICFLMTAVFVITITSSLDSLQTVKTFFCIFCFFVLFIFFIICLIDQFLSCNVTSEIVMTSSCDRHAGTLHICDDLNQAVFSVNRDV